MIFKVGLVLTFAFASCMAEPGYPNVRPDEQLSYDQGYNYQNPHDQLSGDEISGVAGRDYPIFREVPQTRFECEQQQYPGYYADPEAECQAFHICQRDRKDSFLCPNGTLFNQARLVCEWWYNVDCSRAQSFYSINEAVAKAMEEADRRIRLAAEEKLSRGYLRESNADAGHWNKHNQQNAKQGWNDSSARHNSIHNLAKNLPYGTPAAPIRPVYGAPEISAKSNIDNGHWNNQQSAKQGWNDASARQNVMFDFAKNLPYEAPAISARPVYGAPEYSAKSNVDNGHWNNYNQQNAKQGWNDAPARHNVMSDFIKNLPYEVPATSVRPIYGAPEVSANSLPNGNNRPIYGVPEVSANSLPNANYGDSYSQEQNYMITDAKFGKQTTQSNFVEPAKTYLPA